LAWAGGGTAPADVAAADAAAVSDATGGVGDAVGNTTGGVESLLNGGSLLNADVQQQ
jgi:hypothetical protein